MTNQQRWVQVLSHPSVQERIATCESETLNKLVAQVLEDEAQDGELLTAIMVLATYYLAATHNLGTMLIAIAKVQEVFDAIPHPEDDTDTAKEAVA